MRFLADQLVADTKPESEAERIYYQADHNDGSGQNKSVTINIRPDPTPPLPPGTPWLSVVYDLFVC
jgi:hypothetical protein